MEIRAWITCLAEGFEVSTIAEPIRSGKTPRGKVGDVKVAQMLAVTPDRFGSFAAEAHVVSIRQQPDPFVSTGFHDLRSLRQRMEEVTFLRVQRFDGDGDRGTLCQRGDSLQEVNELFARPRQREAGGNVARAATAENEAFDAHLRRTGKSIFSVSQQHADSSTAGPTHGRPAGRKQLAQRMG